MPEAETRTPETLLHAALAAEGWIACSRESPRKEGIAKAKCVIDDGRCTVN